MIDKETKLREECSVEGLIWLGKVDGARSKCSCIVCGHVDDYQQNNIRHGKAKCTACQIAKYKAVLKDGWTFINNYCETASRM